MRSLQPGQHQRPHLHRLALRVSPAAPQPPGSPCSVGPLTGASGLRAPASSGLVCFLLGNPGDLSAPLPWEGTFLLYVPIDCPLGLLPRGTQQRTWSFIFLWLWEPGLLGSIPSSAADSLGALGPVPAALQPSVPSCNMESDPAFGRLDWEPFRAGAVSLCLCSAWREGP